LNILITGAPEASSYASIVGRLCISYPTYLFQTEMPVKEGAKFTLLQGSSDDISLFESAFQQVDLTTLFLEKPKSGDLRLIPLLEKVKLTLDIGIHLNKKVLIVSDANKELTALTDKQGKGEWRSSSENSNWVRFQYLVEQEVERARAENLETTILWHSPIQKEKTIYQSINAPTSFCLNTSENQLFAEITYLVEHKGGWKDKYFLAGEPSPTDLRPFHQPKRKSFFQKLFGKKESTNTQWNVVDKSFIENDLPNLLTE